jgi:hypothetical protein
MMPCITPRHNRTLQLRPMSTPVVFAEKLVGQEWRVAVPVPALARARAAPANAHFPLRVPPLTLCADGRET